MQLGSSRLTVESRTDLMAPVSVLRDTASLALVVIARANFTALEGAI